jgi:hypothetical protein
MAEIGKTVWQANKTDMPNDIYDCYDIGSNFDAFCFLAKCHYYYYYILYES